MYKSSSTGPFTIPTAPQIGTAVVAGAANTYTTTYVQLIASTAAALYITGVHVNTGTAVTVPAYVNVQIATGAAGSEVVIGQIQLSPDSATTTTAVKTAHVPIWPWIPVATSTRIAVKVADNLGTTSWNVTLQCMQQSLVVVDSNVREQVDVQTWLAGTIPAVTTTGVPKVDVQNWNAVALATTNPLPNAVAGAANGLQICGACAATTYATLTSTGAFTVNGVSAVSQTGDSYARIGAAGASLTAITGVTLAASQHVIVDSGTVTTLTNLPSIPANWITATGITASALNGKGDWLLSSSYTAPTNLTAAQIATGVWTDTTGTDFTTALSIGKSVMNGVTLGTGLKIAECVLTDTLTTYTGNTVQTGDSFARIGVAGVGLTNLGDTRIANLDATVSSRSTYAGGAVASVTGSVGSVVGLTAANLDVAISTRMATYTQPTGFLAATFPTGTIANTTNITAGTITTTTNLTNAATAGDLTTAMKTSVENAAWEATAASHNNAGTMGAKLNAAGGAADPWATSLPGAYGAGTAGYIIGTNIDTNVGSRSTYSGGAVASVTASVTANVKTINGVTILGDGSANPFHV